MKDPLTPSENLKSVFSSDEFRSVGHEMIDMLADYLDEIQSDSPGKVLPYSEPETELAFWEDNFTKEEPIQATFKAIFDRSIKIQNPRYIGHQIAAVAPISSISSIMIDMLNNGTGIYEMGMAANAIERIIINFLNQHTGYTEDAGGIITSGGTLANLTALLTARKIKVPTDVWNEGHSDQLAVMVSEASHYCIDRAARIMGLGEKGVIKIPTDDQFKIRTDLLPQYLAEAKANGLHVFAIVGCSCSTSTGSFDDLGAIAEFAEKHNLWFHVDGAHGGGVILSEKYKHLAEGIALSDSIAIDFHKMMLVPALCTALLYKNNQDSYKTFSQTAEYLFDNDQSYEWYNSGKRTFECTKNMMCVKVYSILKAHGKHIFAQNIEHLFDQARLLATLIKNRPGFELLVEPEANIVNYRYHPQPNLNDNLYTDKIRETILKEGKFYIVSVLINGKKYLRSSVMNPLTESTHFAALLDEIERIGSTIQVS